LQNDNEIDFAIIDWNDDKVIYNIEFIEDYDKDIKYIKDFFNNLGFSEISETASTDNKLYFGNFQKDGNSYSFYTSSKKNYVTEDDYVKIGGKLKKIKNKYLKLFINSAENFHIVTFVNNNIDIEQFKKLIENLGFLYVKKFKS